jgi:hypothetical protein
MDFFSLSKALAVFTDPLNFLAVVLLAALVLLWRGRWTGARRLLAFAVAALFAVTLFPIGNLLLFGLEQRARGRAAAASYRRVCVTLIWHGAMPSVTYRRPEAGLVVPTSDLSRCC